MRVPFAVLLVGACCTPLARAQYSARVPRPVKAPVSTAGVLSGGFLMGADDCNGAHTLLPDGPQMGVPFTTGTTGAQGQNEANCLAFGTTVVDNDVWFDWECTSTGNAVLSTCGGNSVDTRVAAYPGTPGACPADGSSLACNDDACGLQSSILWPVTAGSTYTIQLGNFPGAAGGSGTFDIVQATFPPCGQHDDGTSENSFGLNAGGEIGWLHSFDGCFYEYESVDTAYGTAAGAGSQVPNGAPSRIAIYGDADCGDPTTGLVLLASLATVVTNVDTDILNANPILPRVSVANCSWIMATAEHAAGQFPAPMDQTQPTEHAWVVGQTAGAGGMLDLDDLSANGIPPLQMEAIGFPTAWLLRARGDGEAWAYPSQCMGEACPCGNDASDGSSGCDNSLSGTEGALLVGGGFAELSDDEFGLTVFHTPNQPGMFFQGSAFLLPAPSFGDGLRCCGVDVVRCGTYLPVAHTTNTGNGNLVGGDPPPISAIGPNVNLEPGDVRCYQWWYRDTANGPCGTGFNLSNSIAVTWQP